MNRSETAIYSQESSAITINVIFLWTVAHLLLCLVGNIIVLISTAKFRAIRLDPVSVALIQHLAIADVSYMFSHAALALPGYVAKKWILGGFMCGACTVMTYVFAITSMYLICLLNLNKMLTLKYPLKSILKRRRTGHILAACVWIWGAATVTITWLITIWKFEFRLNILHCLELSEHEDIKQLIISTVTMIPIGIIVITTLWLMRFVHRARGLQVQGAVPLVLVSIIFIVSWLPYGLYNAVIAFLPDDDIVKYARVLATTDVISVFIMYFNFSSNPVIYYFSVKSFKEFVYRMFVKKTFTKKVFDYSSRVEVIVM